VDLTNQSSLKKLGAWREAKCYQPGDLRLLPPPKESKRNDNDNRHASRIETSGTSGIVGVEVDAGVGDCIGVRVKFCVTDMTKSTLETIETGTANE